MVRCVVITTPTRYFMTIRGGGLIVLRSSTPGPYFSPPNVRQSSPLSCTTRPQPDRTHYSPQPHPYSPYSDHSPYSDQPDPLHSTPTPHTPHTQTPYSDPILRPLHPNQTTISPVSPNSPIPRPYYPYHTPISPLLSPVSPNSPIKATRAPTSDLLPH